MSISDAINPPPLPLPARAVQTKVAFILGCLISAIAVGSMTADWLFGVLGAAIVGGLVGGAVARALALGRVRFALSIVLLLVALVGTAAAQVWWKRATLPNRAFVHAFGVTIPSSIANLQVKRSYAGGPGDSITLIRFHAEPDVAERLLASPRFLRDALYDAEFTAGRMSAAEYWAKAFSNFSESVRLAWWPSQNPPLVDPAIYRQSAGVTDSTWVIWDRKSGEVFVLIVVG